MTTAVMRRGVKQRGASGVGKPPLIDSDKCDDSSEASPRTSFFSLAIFGDSTWALAASFALLVVAIGIALSLDDESNNQINPVPQANLGPIPRVEPPRIFRVSNKGESMVSKVIRSAYERDGVVAVRGLLTPEQLEGLEAASNELVKDQQSQDSERGRRRTGTQFYTVKVGAAFLETPGKNGTLSAFRQVALFSDIPKFAAELLQLDESKNDTMRMLRDIFLAKDEDEYICGYHVDDTGFWPATGSSPGVNAWIAIDDMPTENGGGFALAVGSHKAPWRRDAHEVTGSTMTFPPEGFRDASHLFSSRSGSGTCNLKTAAPHLHQRMEDTKRIYEMRRGDVIFHDRWLFHRTVPFERSVVEEHQKSDEVQLLYRRYSVRYSPGWAEIPKGYGTELSVLWDDANGGRTADDVAAEDGPWYPLCFPSGNMDEMEQLEKLIEEKMPVAEERRKARKEEMKPYLLELGKQKGRPSPSKG